MTTKGREEIERIRAVIAQERRYVQALIKAHIALYGETWPIVLVESLNNPNRQWHATMIAPCTFSAGKWQATYFDDDGFSGHTVYNTQYEAVWQEYVSGKRRLDYRLLERMALSERFQRGNAWSMARVALWYRRDLTSAEKMQRENELHDRFYSGALS